MKIYEIVNRYDLHDSLIEDAIYIEHKKEVVINIELCNWKQAGYEETDPEMIEGKIVFTGVKLFKADPTNPEYKSDEVIDVSCSFDETSESEFIKFVLRGESDIKVIVILAKDVKVYF